MLAAGVGLGALVLTLAGLVARRVPPSSAWWLQLAALLLPGVAPSAGLTGLGWMIWAVRGGRGVTWLLAAVHLAVAGIVLWHMLGGGVRATASNGPALRVLTLNSAWSRRGEVDTIRQRFSEAQPHVVALQEISIRPGPEAGEWVAQGAGLALLEDSIYTLTTLDQPRDPGRWLTNGTALFVRTPASLSEPVLLDPTSRTHSGKYTRTEIEWEGHQIAVYNVHFRSFAAPRPTGASAGIREWLNTIQASKLDFLAREAEARVLRRALDAESLPFIVAGDFNATPDQWTYAHVAEGLTDALDVARGIGWTYPDARPVVRIDGILASSDWVVRRASVQPRGVSDHRPVLADLELKR